MFPVDTPVEYFDIKTATSHQNTNSYYKIKQSYYPYLDHNNYHEKYMFFVV